jgi:dTDP-4-amino-4,6-dideoxygalactose transaminase
VGARPIYVDVDPDSLTMSADDLERKVTSRSRALIIQHTFGYPANMDKLLAIARRYNLYVIEDCAHALGATYHDRQVGSFGDASFFSFGRDKVVSSIFGGVVCTRDEKTARYFRQAQQRYSYPSNSWVVQHLFHPLICEAAKKTYSIGLGKGILALARKFRLISSPVEAQERQGEKASFLFHRFSPALAQLALHQLRKLERLNEHRQHLAQLYQQKLLGSRFHLQLPVSKTDPIYLRFAVQHPQRKEIMQAAKDQNIILGDWYTTPIAPAGVDAQKIQYNPCPTAEALAENTLNLPTDIHITDADAARILAVLQPYL